MAADYQTLNTLWEQYDERPARVQAIIVRPENITQVAEALAAQGIPVAVDFKNQILSFEDDNKSFTVNANRDCIIITHGTGFQVWPHSILRAGWRKFTGEDW